LPPAEEKESFSLDAEERELLRIILVHGNVMIRVEAEDEKSENHDIEITLAEFIIFELWRDGISFENPIHQTVFDEIEQDFRREQLPTVQKFSQSEHPLISSFVINHVISNHELSSRWVNFGVYVNSEVTNIKGGALHLLYSLKEKKLHAFIHEKQEMLKIAEDAQVEEILNEIKHLNELKSRVNKLLGRIVVK